MKKILTCAVSALALASCSSDSLVSDSPANTQAPIAFNAGQKNITRAGEVSNKLEDNGHYNFGVWAYKTRTSGDPTSQLVMDNYLVGYSNETDKKGYEHSGSTTWDGTQMNSSLMQTVHRDHLEHSSRQTLSTESFSLTADICQLL